MTVNLTSVPTVIVKLPLDCLGLAGRSHYVHIKDQ